MMVSVSDIMGLMEKIAPVSLAEKWDNPGLQIGKKDWPVKNIGVALDPVEDVILSACENKVDLLITHHPLFFQPIRSLDFSTPVGRIIHKAVTHQLAVFSAHTNLDSAKNGLNDLFCHRVGLTNIRSLVPMQPRQDQFKLVVYAPVLHEQKILDALFDTPAGRIGEYTCCSFRNRGIGTFLPSDKASPFSGRIRELSHEDEIRIEVVVEKKDVQTTVNTLRAAHPYETMACDIYPLFSTDIPHAPGLGRVGELENETNLYDLGLHVKTALGIKHLRMVGPPETRVQRVAVCTGSGGSLIRDARNTGAQVYITGDIRYHDAQDAKALGLALIDAGHFESEIPVVDLLTKQLDRMTREQGFDVTVTPCRVEKTPFVEI